jgi:hypothetical protein
VVADVSIGDSVGGDTDAHLEVTWHRFQSRLRCISRRKHRATMPPSPAKSFHVDRLPVRIFATLAELAAAAAVARQ